MLAAQALLLSIGLMVQTPGSSIEEMLKSKEACAILSERFEGNPPKERIRYSLDRVLQACDMPTTEENRLRAGSVLILFRKEEGAREMHFLEYLGRNVKPGSKLTFPEAAGLFLAAYKIDYPNGSPPDRPAGTPARVPRKEVEEKPVDPRKRAADKLRLAQSLEKQNKPQGALSLYNDIVKLFPDSPEAAIARKRIKVLNP